MNFKSYISAFAICITIMIVSACAQKSPMLEEQSKRLHQPPTGTPNAIYSTAVLPHNGEVEGVVFSPDGQYLATACMDGTVRLWDVITQTQIWQSQHDDSALRVAFSPDGRFVLSGGLDNKARVWNAVDGSPIAALQHQAAVSAVAISPGGKTAASGDRNGEVLIWNVSDWTERFRIHIAEGEVSEGRHVWRTANLSFHPHGKLLAASSGYKTDQLEVWNIQTGQRLWSTQTYDLRSLIYSPDGKTLLAGGSDKQGLITFWDASSPEIKRVYQHDSGDGHIWDIAFTALGRAFYTGGTTDNSIHLISVGDNAAFQRTHVFSGHKAHVQSIAVSPLGNILASGSADGTVRLWKIPDDNRLDI